MAVLDRMSLCALLLAGPLSASAGESATDTTTPAAPVPVQANLRRAKRYFDGGRFAQAEAIYADLLKKGAIEDLHRVEGARFYWARCRLEQATSSEELKRAIQLFRKVAENRLHLDNPVYDKAARFSIGRAFLKAGQPTEAAAALRDVLEREPPPELEAETRWYCAKALQMQADGLQARTGPSGKPADSRRKVLLREAVGMLREITMAHPRSAHAEKAEVDLIRLYMDLRQHQKAIMRAGDFLKRPRATKANRARVLLFRAQCAYSQGELNAAVHFYGQLLEGEDLPPKVRLDALYELGWGLSRLAQTAGGEAFLRMLSRARRRMSQALRAMPETDSRRNSALYILAEVLVKLGEYREATERLEPLLQNAAWRGRAHYVAGQACRGRHDYNQALTHFKKAFAAVEQQRPSRFLVEVLRHLAELETERRAYGEALQYYRRMGTAARELRDYATLAASELGIAKSLIDLVGPQESQAEAEEAAAPAEDGDRRPPGIHHLDKAIAVLERLRKRYKDRVRADELAYEEGRADFYTALVLHWAALAKGERRDHRVDQVLQLHAQAAKHLEASRKANPRGHWAPWASFTLGRARAAEGAYLEREAARLHRAGRLAEAESRRHEARERLEWALAPFRDAIHTSDRDALLRARSRMRLGEVYFQLEAYAKAVEPFRAVANDPEMPERFRFPATRAWAEALDRLGRTDEGVRRLRPHIERDPASAILAGRLLEKLQRPREAYQSYRAAVPAADAAHQRNVAAEARYRASRLALRKAAQIVPASEEEAFRRTAEKGLRKLASDDPQTDWASQALLELGAHLLETGRWQEAVRLAEKTAAETGASGLFGNVIHQTAYLLKGRALLAGRRPSAAAEALEEAIDVPGRAAHQRALRAAATRELGNVARASGDPKKALDRYGDAFARYPDVASEADQARVATTEVHLELWQEAMNSARAQSDDALAQARRAQARQHLERAYRVLEGGQDRALMLETRRRLDQAVKQAEERRRTGGL